MNDQRTPTIAALIVLSAEAQPGTYYLTGPTFTLGRAPTCDLVIPRSTISRVHARIESSGLRYVLHDADSANGTFVNGERIAGPYLLHHQDRIGLGAPRGDVAFQDPDPTLVAVSRLRYDARQRAFFLDQQPLALTPLLSRLLLHLYDHAGQLCTRESCAAAIWGNEFDPGRDGEALDRLVSNLRAALRAIDPDYAPIATARGQGYRLAL